MKRSRWALLAAAAAVLALGGWWFADAPESRAQAVAPLPVAAASPAVQPPARVSAPTQPVAPRVASAASAPVTHWDLCGVGRVPIPAAQAASAAGGLPELPEHLGTYAQEQARERALEALRRGSERERAVALLWADRQAGAPALGAMAAGTTDPMVLRLAMQVCGGRLHAGTQACTSLAPDALARAEPDNLVGWLLWAARPCRLSSHATCI
jgi:hypothetical protein